MDRTERFYRIELMIRGRGCVSFQALRDELEVSPATLKRDLQYLRDRMDAPIVYDRDEDIAATTKRHPAIVRHRTGVTHDGRLIAQEIEEFNNATMAAQHAEVSAQQAAFASDLRALLWWTLLLGTIVALTAVIRLRVLERRSEQERSVAEDAERQMRSLSQQLVATQEEERKKLSRELHDHVGQVLAKRLDRFLSNPRRQSAHLNHPPYVREGPVSMRMPHLDVKLHRLNA